MRPLTPLPSAHTGSTCHNLNQKTIVVRAANMERVKVLEVTANAVEITIVQTLT
jgi:hypothetical protein